MERIQEKINKVKSLDPTDEQLHNGVQELAKYLEYLLAENKRLEDTLKKIVHRATAYTNNEVPAIVLDEIRGMAAYATNPWAREEGKRGGLVNPDGGDYPLKWMATRDREEGK